MSGDPVPFSEFMEDALYAPGSGFYEQGGRAGRSRGDFLTSPEVGPLFGAVLARALDRWWDEFGRPDPFVVHEHGAGVGTLVRTVGVAEPRCRPALAWTLVERSASQRALHSDLAGGDLAVTSVAERPGSSPHLIVANELLDNLPFDLFERSTGEWREVRVAGGTEVLTATSEARSALLDALAPDARPGARVPLQDQAAEWTAASLAQVRPGGRLLVIDYASTTPDLAVRPWREWVRTYAGHGRGGHPLEAPGRQDITVEVCVDQLARAARPPESDRDQASFLHTWRIDELVEEGQRAWRTKGLSDLGALRARSRATEAPVLCDPNGLGAFRVLEWRG